jgi:hypothetical protein
MSLLNVVPDAVTAAARNLQDIGTVVKYATGAAAAQTTAIAAPAADEVSAAITALFGTNAQEFQALSAQATAFHDRFASLLGGGAAQYLSTEAANAQQTLVNAVNTPAQALLGRPLVGTGQGIAGAAGANPAAGISDTVSQLVNDFAPYKWTNNVTYQSDGNGGKVKVETSSLAPNGEFLGGKAAGAVGEAYVEGISEGASYIDTQATGFIGNSAFGKSPIGAAIGDSTGFISSLATDFLGGKEFGDTVSQVVTPHPLVAVTTITDTDAFGNTRESGLNVNVLGANGSYQTGSGGIGIPAINADALFENFVTKPVDTVLTNSPINQYVTSVYSSANDLAVNVNNLFDNSSSEVTNYLDNPQNVLTQVSDLPTQLQTQLFDSSTQPSNSGFGPSFTWTSEQFSPYGDGGIQLNATGLFSLNAGPFSAPLGFVQGFSASDMNGGTASVSVTVFGFNETEIGTEAPWGSSPQFFVSGHLPGF